MNLKDHLQHNKMDLEHKAPVDIWNRIDSNLKTGNKNNYTQKRIYTLAGIAIIVSVLFLVVSQYNQSQKTNAEIKALKTAMTDLLKDQSVGRRIKAVSMSDQLKDSNQEIAQVLLQTMTDDPSKNVKLAAINALGKYVDNEDVRIGIIEYLAKAKDPYIQIKLINILAEIKEKKAVPALELIIKDTKNILVKNSAEEGREIITKA